MASEVTMPKMGYDMTEGTLLKWVKHEGDTVAKGEVLGEIETGKVNIEIEAFDGGVLRRILVQEGETVPVGTPIAIIAGADEVLPAPAPTSPRPAAAAPTNAADQTGAATTSNGASASAGDAATHPAASSAAAPSGIPTPAPSPSSNGAAGAAATAGPAVDGAVTATATSVPGAATPSIGAEAVGDADGRLRISPLARRLTVEHALPVSALHGSGPFGRIVRDDVLEAVAHGGAAPADAGAAAPASAGLVAAPMPLGTPMATPIGPGAKITAPLPAVYTPGAPPPADVTEALSRMRQTIARRLTESWTAAPHIFVTVPIHMDEAMALRKQANALLEPAGRPKVSVNDLVLKAAALALRQHPRMNSSWVDGQRLVHGRVTIGVAVALDDGLITVSVPDADAKPLSAIAAEVAAKAERARAGHLLPEDVAVPSSFTVTNLGGLGVEEFTAIINPPEAAILAVGAATPTPVVVGGEVVVRTVMRVTLSADHRVVDGASAALFLATLRQLLEQPVGMLI